MNKIQAILSKLQPVGQAVGQDLGGATSNFRRELGSLVGQVGTTAGKTADSFQERAVNRILQDINSNPSPSLLNTMGEIAAKRGIANNPVEALDLARDLQRGGNVSSPQLLGLGAGEAVARAVANRPGAALATAGGTGAVGGLALITASGQALADLGNFLAGGQENQDTRDNVLRS